MVHGLAGWNERISRRRATGQLMSMLGALGILGCNTPLSGSVAPTPTPLPFGKLLLTYKEHRSEVFAVGWSPDGKAIASAGNDRAVRIWDPDTGATSLTYQGHKDVVGAVAWSRDGERLASAGAGPADQTVQVWQRTTGEQLITYRGHTQGVLTLAWSPDGAYVASAGIDRSVQVWSAMTGKTVFTYRGHRDEVHGLAWSPDGKRLASASWDGTVQVWQALSGAPQVTYRGHSGRVSAVAWSPDGAKLASGSWDKTLQTWDALTGKHLFTYQSNPKQLRPELFLVVAWSHTGKRLAGLTVDGECGLVEIWNTASSAPPSLFRDSYSVLDIAWSPDDTRMVSTSGANLVKIWWAV